MSPSSRAKGARFEARVAAAFTKAGLDIRSFQRNKDGEADHLIVTARGTFSGECKNQERLQLPQWWKQTVVCAPAGTAPLLTFNLAGEMLTVVRTADLLPLLAVVSAGSGAGT